MGLAQLCKPCPSWLTRSCIRASMMPLSKCCQAHSTLHASKWRSTTSNQVCANVDPLCIFPVGVLLSSFIKLRYFSTPYFILKCFVLSNHCSRRMCACARVVPLKSAWVWRLTLSDWALCCAFEGTSQLIIKLEYVLAAGVHSSIQVLWLA